MDEMSPAVAVTLSLGNSVCDNSGITTQVEITRLKLVTDSASLLLDPTTVHSAETVLSRDGKCSNLVNGVDTVIMSKPEDKSGGADLSDLVSENGSSWTASDTMIPESEEDEVLLVVDDCNGVNHEQFLVLDTNSGISLTSPVDIQNIGNSQIVAKAINLGISSIELESSGALLTAAMSSDAELSELSIVEGSSVVLRRPSEKNLDGGVGQSFELNCVPLWGSVSIRGRRPEMEDTVAAVPWSVKIPIKMLIGDQVIDRVSQSLSHLPSHFFGVYDGHGGAQVANYCRDRIHLVLAEEIKIIEDNLGNGSMRNSCLVQWEMAFTSCFEKVDDEVGGKVTSGVCFSPIAPETVGSTAVVALVCSSHFIVANCGDSRAVLCRGRKAIALSIDHKPNREDEYARIEGSGGKVIQWNGHRVFGVLAMSRAIGDKYLKPWIIPDPEVMLVPRAREDECLVLASDGLWDVMTNEEVCEVARRRLLLWHKKNGVTPIAERGEGVDPAAQAAAEYLSVLALRKGSKDNISVIVVDLKAQRKFKNKTG